MQKIIMLLTFVVSTSTALAKDYSLPELCDAKIGKRMEFSKATHEKIVKEMKGMKEESKEWKAFADSDMFDWLSVTDPKALPKFAKVYDALGCSNFYTTILVAKDKKSTDKNIESWKNCLNSAYQNEPPAIAADIQSCFSTTAPAESVLKSVNTK